MSNIVSIVNGEALTTSTAIAEGVGNPHATVIKLIREYASDLEDFGLLDFKSESTAGRPTEYALLNEQQATLLMTYMRNSDIVRQFKKRLVKAFYEMASDKKPMSTLELIDMMRDTEIKRIAAEEAQRRLSAELDIARPKIAFHDSVTQSEDAITVAEAAKILNTGRSRLFAFMRHKGWVTRKNEPYQMRIEQGYLGVKLSSFEHPDNGLQKSVTTLITGKGLARLQKIYSARNLAA